MYIAEGSDWFWWYGDDHSSAQNDAVRLPVSQAPAKRLSAAGRQAAAGPGAADQPHGPRVLHTLPRAFLDVKIDGRETFFEWLSAGRYTSQNERGTMAMGARGPIRDVYFGFDLQNLLRARRFRRPGRSRPGGLRHGAASPSSSRPTGKCASSEPGSGRRPAGHAAARGQLVAMPTPPDLSGRGQDIRDGRAVRGSGHRRRISRSSSSSICWRDSRAAIGRRWRGRIRLTCPSVDFERIMWDV